MSEFRLRVGSALMTWAQVFLMKRLGSLCLFIVGKQNALALARASIEKVRAFTADLPMNAAKNGLAHEAQSLNVGLDKLAASIRPDSTWTFHKVDLGRVEGVIMPRTIDSNTVVVTATTDPNIKLGDVITIDGNPPNCEAGALQMIIQERPTLLPEPSNTGTVLTPNTR